MICGLYKWCFFEVLSKSVCYQLWTFSVFSRCQLIFAGAHITGWTVLFAMCGCYQAFILLSQNRKNQPPATAHPGVYTWKGGAHIQRTMTVFVWAHSQKIKYLIVPLGAQWLLTRTITALDKAYLFGSLWFMSHEDLLSASKIMIQKLTFKKNKCATY